MFILRRITSDDVERNTVLGDNYILIKPNRNKDDFDLSVEKTQCDKKDIYGFISHEEGTKLIPLYNKSCYFIMMGTGQTFAHIRPE